jgi:DNA-binding NarL/FixJ family response regulator
MYDSVFQVLFLGEALVWSKVAQALADAPGVPLKIHRLGSLADLFRSIANGQWHAVALDVNAWNFQGLHFVEKIRSEHPVFPIIALHESSVTGIDTKAMNLGASCCLAVDDLTMETLYGSIQACHSENNTNLPVRSGLQMQSGFETNDFPVTRYQAISHAMNNLLCVISAHADILSEHLDLSEPVAHNVAEIKKAAKSAAEFMRHLK